MFEFTGPIADLSDSWTTGQLAYTTTNDDGYVQLDTLAALSDFVAGTGNQITVTDDGDGTITLSTPQDIGTGSTPTFAGVTATSTLTKDGVNVYNVTEGDAAYEAELDNSAGLAAALDDETGTGVAVFGTAPTFTTSITITGADADPTAAGDIVYDSTVSGVLGGALRWYDNDSVRLIVDLETDPSDDDYVVAYDAAADGFYMKVDAGAAGGDSIEIDSVAVVDPDFQDTSSINITDTANVVTMDVKADGITEAMLKAVNGPTDEYVLTYESTTGDFEWQASAAGYTNLTSFVDQTAWRLFYSNADGDVTELALGADGTYLKSNGAAVAPTFATPAGSGDLLADGTVPLTANWDVGAYYLTALRYISDVATGTAPLTVASTTVVTNLNADLLDGESAAAFEDADAAIVKSDEAETLTANWVNTDHPWADNEVADDITAGNAATVTTNANMTGDVTSSGNATTLAEWETGNTVYVGISDDIETAVAAATAGDTIVLAAGTYTVTDDIDVAQAVTIKGQGRNATVLNCVTDSKNVFHVTASNVAILDLDITVEASATPGILVDGTAGAVIGGIIIENVEVTLASHAGAQNAIYFNDASGTVRNSMAIAYSTDSGALAIAISNAASAEAARALYVYDSYAYASGGGGVAAGLYSLDDSATQGCYLFAYDCYAYAVEAAACASYGIGANGSDAYITGYFGYSNGTDYSAANINTAGKVELRGWMLGAQTTTGTVLQASNLNVGSLVLKDRLHLPYEATPTTDEDGKVIVDLDGWGSGYDAIEFFNGTASAYLVATTASDTPTDGQVPKWNTGGTITWEDDNGAAGGDAWGDDVDADIIPATDDTYDLGDSTHEFTDGWFDGTLYADVLSIPEGALADSTIVSADIKDDTIDSADYAAGSIDNEHLADNAVDSDELAAGSVDLAHLAAGIKSGDDATVITGTAGTNGYISQWNADGDLVDGIALSTVGVATGDTWTGVHDFGGATSTEIVNSSNPTTDAAGEIAVDSDDNMVELFGTESRVIGSVYTVTKTIWTPDLIQSVEDAIPLMSVPAEAFPHGIIILDIWLKADASNSGTYVLEEWTEANPPAHEADIESISFSASTLAEDDGTLSSATVNADKNIFLDMDNTDLNWLTITWTYKIIPGD